MNAPNKPVETIFYNRLVDIGLDLKELANETLGALKLIQDIQGDYITTNKHDLIGQTINKISEDIVYLESKGAKRSELTISITKDFERLLRSYISTEVVNDLSDVSRVCGLEVSSFLDSDNVFTYKIKRRYK